MVDYVNHPPHYTAYKSLEIIDLTEQMNFNRGNAVKYITRAGLKGEGLEKEIEDLEKAVWYIKREINRIAWSIIDEELKAEAEPTCDICSVMERDADAWCGNCGSCAAHCHKNESCVSAEDLRPPKTSFCPHSLRPTFTHLQEDCQRTQVQLSFDLKKFDSGDTHFIATRNVHLTFDEVVDEVRKMRDVGSRTGSFVVSTYRVDDEG